jgi:hypothetical protein
MPTCPSINLYKYSINNLQYVKSSMSKAEVLIWNNTSLDVKLPRFSKSPGKSTPGGRPPESHFEPGLR